MRGHEAHRGMAGTPSAVRMAVDGPQQGRDVRPAVERQLPAELALATHAGEARLGRQVVPVGVDVLAQQRHFLVAGGGQRRASATTSSNGPAALRARG